MDPINKRIVPVLKDFVIKNNVSPRSIFLGRNEMREWEHLRGMKEQSLWGLQVIAVEQDTHFELG